MFKDNPLLYWLTYQLCLQPALTQTTSKEQDCLIAHAQGRNKLVEIGVWHGVNTRRLRGAMNTDGTIYAVDPFPLGKFATSWQKKIARREAEATRNGRLIWLEDYSCNAFEEFQQMDDSNIDFIFIDGDHSYEGVKTDWSLWTPRLAVGGVVALHDSRSYEDRSIDQTGAARFTKDVVLHDARFRLLETVHSLTVMERI
jgi:predicted O-methyltransferase YrrM